LGYLDKNLIENSRGEESGDQFGDVIFILDDKQLTKK
jgi:hypothetical protein